MPLESNPNPMSPEPQDEPNHIVTDYQNPPFTQSEKEDKGGFWAGFFVGVIFTLMVGGGVCVLML